MHSEPRLVSKLNNKQKQIFRKLAEIFSKYDLDDVNVALAAFRDEDLLNDFAEGAAHTKRVSKRPSKDKVARKRPTPQKRLTELEQEIATTASDEAKYALSVAMKLLDRNAFSGAPRIRDVFEDLDIAVGKSVSDRSQLVIHLFSALKDQPSQQIRAVEKKLDEYSSENSSLADWSRVINRKDGKTS